MDVRRLAPALVLFALAPCTSQEPQPFAEQRIAARQETVIRPQYATDVREFQSTVFVPVVRYHYQYQWRPLRPGQSGYYLTPRMAWEPRAAEVRVPVTTQTFVAETRTVQAPYLALGFRETPQAPRTSAAPTPTRNTTTLDDSGWRPARASLAPQQVGGIVQYEGDPPRRGMHASGGSIAGHGSATVLR